MASKESYALKVGERILVTGANGFIGSNIVDFLLSLGYIVRGTVRSEKPWVNEVFESKYGAGKFEPFIVPNLDDKEAIDAVLKGVSGVVHVASDTSFSADASKVINSVVAAIEAVLEAASKVPSVKRVVLTSSSVAAAPPRPPGEGSLLLTQDTWNDASVKEAWDEDTPAEIKGFSVYAASKTEGERAASNWVKKNNPGFTFNSVLPDYTTGNLLHPTSGSTGLLLLQLLEGNNAAILMGACQYYIDVKDLARLHAIALLDPSVKSERLFGYASPLIWRDVVSTLRELCPTNEKLIKDEDIPPVGGGFVKVVPPNRSKELLSSFFGQDEWTSLRESLEAGVNSLGL
ncbi:putative aldehyde reductase [Aspergillus cavernicola]|uniref:Aldehyde reductase n=1 Tax=Aspergillus cavernicola TaxID=176166 RepID=A0ABR4I3H3_9EURO